MIDYYALVGGIWGVMVAVAVVVPFSVNGSCKKVKFMLSSMKIGEKDEKEILCTGIDMRIRE